MMNSLRSRLFSGITAFVILVALAGSLATFNWAYREAIELQDSVLEQVADLAFAKPLVLEPSAQQNVDAEARLTLEELGAAAPSASQIAPLDLPDGLHTIRHGERAWRTLISTRTDKSRFAVSQSTAYRDEVARDSALRTIWPLVLLVPCLLFLVAIVIHFSFRPVANLAAQLDQRRGRDLEKLSPEAMPGELLPFVASINRLLERLEAMFTQQQRFIADAAHELRSPLTALSLQAENLAHVEMLPDGKQRLSVLQDGIRRTSHLLEQLLALARVEAVSDGGAVAFDTILKQVVADCQPVAANANVDLGFVALESVQVRGHPTVLSLMVRNLIDNAIRYSPQGGRVDVALTARSGRGHLVVEDSGPGIPEPDLARSIEPFFRGSKAIGNGSGLGLSIVARVVRSIDGVMTLSNGREPGQTGLRIEIEFPLG